jgi:signal transduction histidine kinase/CheY-like chemotaxis protein
MKHLHLRKIAGISVFLTLAFMVLALFQFQSEDSATILPDQLEVSFDKNWKMALPDCDGINPAIPTRFAQILEQAKTTLADENCQKVDLPFTGMAGAGDIIVLQNTVPFDYARQTLSFSYTNADISIIVNGEVIFQNSQQENYTPKKTPEHNENFVELPNILIDGEILITLTPLSPNMAVSLDNVKVESRDMVVIGVVGSSIADIGCCILIVIMSIILFVLALIRLYTKQPARGELFLGLACLSAGIYCFIGTDTLNIFYNIQEAYEMQEYLTLLIPLFLSLYFERNLHTVFPRRFFTLLWFVVLHTVIQILLQLLGIQRLENMMNISAAVLGIVCITAIVSLIQYDYKNKTYQALLCILSMLALLAGGIANVILNQMLDQVRGNTAGQYSMVVFCIMMALMHTLQISKEYRAKAEETALLLEEKVKAAEYQNTLLALAKQDADAARHEALAANEAKGKFLAHMSHEIRTPINAVLGMDEMILRESNEPQIKEYAMDIYMAGQTLLSLINDILDFSKIESGKMEIVPVEYDVSSLIHDLANMTIQRAKAKNIKVEVEASHEIPARLFGDDVRIRQVLTNILTNAVKYTHEGSVWLRISYQRKKDTAALTFEVEDTGIGIKKEDLPKLSAEFERIEEDRNRNIEGTGLGINITIQLLELLGSRLQVESEYGKGSKFYFELEQKIVDDTPIGDFESRVHQIAENYNYNTKFCAPDAKILVVDDNAVNRKVLRSLLKETQIQVTDADGGAACLELAFQNHYDLIFLDHMMPEMDGIETLHHLKERKESPCKNTPIVVLTANAVSGAKEKYLAEGFDDFLSKPIAPEKLEVMIKRMLPEELVQEAKSSPDAAFLQPRQQDNPSDFLETLPDIDGLDWQYAWMHLPDPELLAFTVKEFYGQIDFAADNLAKAYQRIREPEQRNQYRILVHAMKSLAATIGIMPLSGVAKLLESAARDGKIEVIQSMTDAFLEEWRSYGQKLHGVFGIGATAKKEVEDYSVLQALTELIRQSMLEMDIDRADELMGELREYECPEELSQTIRSLAEAVTNLDADEADRLADLLIGQMQK